jgi:UDP-3-O-[3-hydroxymyristoyl] N-acetylglucosamine deacetylase
MNLKQHTIVNAVSTQGTGIHSGETANVLIQPAEVGTGIVFRRDGVEIPALSPFVKDTAKRCTILHNGREEIQTVEHLMAAFYAHGIDNAYVDIDGLEMPILDGSAKQWSELLDKAERVEQDAPQRVLRILKPIRVVSDDGKGWLEIAPNADGRKGLILDFTVKFDGVPEEHGYWAEDTHHFDEISKAKTFGYIRDLDADMQEGMSRGGNVQNALIIGDQGIMNPTMQSYDGENELARHKAVDLMGDLSLLGMRIEGTVTGHAPGHILNHRLASAILKERGAFEILPKGEQFTSFADEKTARSQTV